MVVMMTTTAFSSAEGLSKDVAKVCTALDSAADAINRAATEQELVNALHNFESADTDLDTTTILTEADKAALKKSFVDFTMSNFVKIVELAKKDTPKSEIEKAYEVTEQVVGRIVNESVTLGDFLENIKE